MLLNCCGRAFRPVPARPARLPPLADAGGRMAAGGVRARVRRARRPCRGVPLPAGRTAGSLLAALLVFCLFRARRAACLLLSLLLAGYALLWAPAYSLPAGHAAPAEVSAAQLTALCGDADGTPQRRGCVRAPGRPRRAGAGGRRPRKNTRPRPRRAQARSLSRVDARLLLAGVYAPWTGEALYDPAAPTAGQPFTAVHELMHMGGVADEGQANICAYIACRRYGGAFSRSADLWALKYAMDALRAADSAAWEACLARLSAPVREEFFALGGASLSLGGVAAASSDYGVLAAWLAARIV